MNDIKIRKYQTEDARALADIYYYTIHNINIKDYTQEQINAWALKESLDLSGRKTKWSKLAPTVALYNSTVAGFAELEQDGHIDCFYVHHKFQKKGIGKKLVKAIEQEAIKNKVSRLHAEVSITAKLFFESEGFKIIKKQTVSIRGKKLINFYMEKIIT